MPVISVVDRYDVRDLRRYPAVCWRAVRRDKLPLWRSTTRLLTDVRFFAPWQHLAKARQLSDVYPSVRLSITSRYCIEIETTGQIELVFGTEASIILPRILHWVKRIIQVPPEISVLSSGNLTQTLHLKHFATTSRSCCQPNLLTTLFPVNASWPDIVTRLSSGNALTLLFVAAVERHRLT